MKGYGAALNHALLRPDHALRLFGIIPILLGRVSIANDIGFSVECSVFLVRRWYKTRAQIKRWMLYWQRLKLPI